MAESEGKRNRRLAAIMAEVDALAEKHYELQTPLSANMPKYGTPEYKAYRALLRKIHERDPRNERVMVMGEDSQPFETSRGLCQDLHIEDSIIGESHPVPRAMETFGELKDRYRELYGMPGRSGGYRHGVPGGAKKTTGHSGKGRYEKGSGERPRRADGSQAAYTNQVQEVVDVNKDYFGAGEEAAQERFHAAHPEFKENRTARVKYSHEHPYEDFVSQIPSEQDMAGTVFHPGTGAGDSRPGKTPFNKMDARGFNYSQEYIEVETYNKLPGTNYSKQVGESFTKYEPGPNASPKSYAGEHKVKIGVDGNMNSEYYNNGQNTVTGVGAAHSDIKTGATTSKTIAVRAFKEQVMKDPALKDAIRKEQTVINQAKGVLLDSQGDPIDPVHIIRTSKATEADKAVKASNLVKEAARANKIADADYYAQKYGEKIVGESLVLHHQPDEPITDAEKKWARAEKKGMVKYLAEMVIRQRELNKQNYIRRYLNGEQ